MVPHDSGRPYGHGANELRGAWASELEHVKACEVKAPCPVMKAMRGSVPWAGRNKDLHAALFLVRFRFTLERGHLHIAM